MKIFFIIALFAAFNANSQDIGEVKKIFQSDGKGMTIITQNNESDILFKKDENGKITQDGEESIDEEKNTPSIVVPDFARLVTSKNYSEIESKLQSGFSPDFILFEGNTALHMASMWGDNNLMNLMLKYKANSNASNNKGETPLHWACARKNLDNIKLLLNNPKTQQANLNKKTKSGMTCVHFASLYHTSTTDSIKLIMSFKPDLKIQDSRGQNPAHYAAVVSRWDILSEILKNSSVNMSEKDSFGNSIENYIVNKGDMDAKANLYRYLSESEKTKVREMVAIHKHLSIKE